jgi:catechol 2,3-dioxygenase-like lactoylglutathione lyase family enzyme
MITDLDHVIIAVRDLNGAIECFQRLGFCVKVSGSFSSLGTHNAIIYLEQTHISLVATYDPVLTMRTLPNADIILHNLDYRDASMLGFVLTTTDVDQIFQNLQGTELGSVPPYDLTSERSGQPPLKLRMLTPGGLPYRRPWPLFYQWYDQTPMEGIQNSYANGITDIARVVVGVENMEQTSRLYQHIFGLRRYAHWHVPLLHMEDTIFKVGSTFIDLVNSSDRGSITKELREVGEGIFAIILSIKDLTHTRAFFERRGVQLISIPLGPNTLLIDPQATLGIRLILAQDGEIEIQQ